MSSPPDRLDVVCFGTVIADIFCPPLQRLPAEGELLQVEGFSSTVGGCAANTGSDLAKLGARVAVVGRVGADIYGEAVKRQLDARGLETRQVVPADGLTTAQTVILPVMGQDRRYIHAPGASLALTTEDLDTSLLDRTRLLYVGGYLALPNVRPSALARVFKEAKDRGVITMLDVIVARDAGPQAELRAAVQEVLPYTDVFAPNDDEGSIITGLTTPAAQASLYLEMGARAVVVTMGKSGFVATNGGRMVRGRAYPVTVVDPSGAGDAFDAGLIYGLLEGWEWERTLALGAALGGSACRALGCHAGVFTLNEALAYIEDHPLLIEPV